MYVHACVKWMNKIARKKNENEKRMKEKMICPLMCACVYFVCSFICLRFIFFFTRESAGANSLVFVCTVYVCERQNPWFCFYFTVKVDLCEQSQNTNSNIEQYVASTSKPISLKENLNPWSNISETAP